MDYRKDLEKYEATDAKGIVDLLKTISLPKIECAPPSFQANVLARLEEKRAKGKWFTWAFRYKAPLAFAAGLVLGIYLEPALLSYKRDTLSVDDPMSFRGTTDTPSLSVAPKSGEAAPNAGNMHQSPEDWLETIAEMLVTGQVSKAYQQLEAFRHQYPRYEQDSATQ